MPPATTSTPFPPRSGVMRARPASSRRSRCRPAHRPIGHGLPRPTRPSLSHGDRPLPAREGLSGTTRFRREGVRSAAAISWRCRTASRRWSSSASSSCASASSWSSRPSTGRRPATRSGSPRACSAAARGASRMQGSVISAAASASACSASARRAPSRSWSARRRRCRAAIRAAACDWSRSMSAAAAIPWSAEASRVPMMTAYRQQALLCAAAIDEGARRPRELRASVPEAAAILQRNVYGWFTRVERGQYGLTQAGAAALARWPQHASGTLEVQGHDLAAVDPRPAGTRRTTIKRGGGCRWLRVQPSDRPGRDRAITWWSQGRKVGVAISASASAFARAGTRKAASSTCPKRCGRPEPG